MLHIALVHFPTIDKNGRTVTTSITNLDIHDICRAGLTYGVAAVWYVHPYTAQQAFLKSVVGHWQEGWGGEYNPNRKEALSIARGALDLSEVAAHIERVEGRRVRFVGTSAQRWPKSIPYSALRRDIKGHDRHSTCLVFGTGWGIHPELMEQFDDVLDPIEGVGHWNHLSVRSAVAIILDRLLASGLTPP